MFGGAINANDLFLCYSSICPTSRPRKVLGDSRLRLFSFDVGRGNWNVPLGDTSVARVNTIVLLPRSHKD